MAAPSLHVICGYAGGDAGDKFSPARQQLFRDPQWSAEPGSGVATTTAAPDKNALVPVFRITPTIDVYVSIGPAPNPAASPRYLLPAVDGQRDIYVKPGDKLAWIAA
jgi:hypothetical protein